MNAPDINGFLIASQRRDAERHRVAVGSFLIGLALGAAIVAAFAVLIG